MCYEFKALHVHPQKNMQQPLGQMKLKKHLKPWPGGSEGVLLLIPFNEDVRCARDLRPAFQSLDRAEAVE